MDELSLEFTKFMDTRPRNRTKRTYTIHDGWKAPTQEWSSYFAGLIDGEGTIGITKNNGRLIPFFCIKMTNAAIINMIADRYCHRVNTYVSKNPKHKKSFSVNFGSWSTIKAMLNEVRPYLIVKQKQADLLISISERIERGEKLSNEEKGRFYETARALNE